MMTLRSWAPSAAGFLLGVSAIAIFSSYCDIIFCSCNAFSHANADRGEVVTARRRHSAHLAILLPSLSTTTTTTLSLQPLCSKNIRHWYHSNRLSSLTSVLFMSSTTQNNNNGEEDDALSTIVKGITRELQELSQCTIILYNYLSKPDEDVTATDIVRACDAIDEAVVLAGAKQQQLQSSASEINTSSALSSSPSSSSSPPPPPPVSTSYLNQYLSLRRRSHQFGRYHLLVKLLRSNYDTYVSTAEFLSPSRISRMELPNVQDVKYMAMSDYNTDGKVLVEDEKGVMTADAEEGPLLVPDCTLENMTYSTSPLDALLLSIFRKFVSEYTQMPLRIDIPGIQGLVAQGRSYMTNELPEGVSYSEHANEQHDMVKAVLGRLMTPVLPPVYRIFMSGILPSNIMPGNLGGGKQLGPWFYAPYLTSIVTPIFFGFLVGPSYPNRRKDGQRGGLVVEKCKFLQESHCKGLCLHQCKLPAQEFFAQSLGLELSVSPNFVTQECQWSFGERPLEVSEDGSFPVGCLVGCESRKGMAVKKGKGVYDSSICM